MKLKLNFVFFMIALFALNGTAQDVVETNLEKEKPHEALIYPNPLSGEKFNVKSASKIKKVEVVNVIGKLITRTENDDIALHNLPIHIGNVDKGIYLVKVSFDDDKSIIKKLLVK